jgi:hypothetical protein
VARKDEGERAAALARNLDIPGLTAKHLKTLANRIPDLEEYLVMSIDPNGRILLRGPSGDHIMIAPRADMPISEFEAWLSANGPGAAAEPEVVGAPAEPPVTIPNWGERLMRMTSGSDDVEAMLGDQAERFAQRLKRDGADAAQAWYRRELAKSVLAFAWRWTRRALTLDLLLNKLG